MLNKDERRRLEGLEFKFRVLMKDLELSPENMSIARDIENDLKQWVAKNNLTKVVWK